MVLFQHKFDLHIPLRLVPSLKGGEVVLMLWVSRFIPPIQGGSHPERGHTRFRASELLDESGVPPPRSKAYL